MKKVVLLLILAAVSWFYFFGRRELNEQSVREFYTTQTHATLGRDPQALCDQLADDFKSIETVNAGGEKQHGESNKAEACESVKSTFDGFDNLGASMGGMVTLDYDHEIEGIEISTDKKTATVKTKFTLDVGGRMMRFRGTATDTLVRRNGRVLTLRSESITRIFE